MKLLRRQWPFNLFLKRARVSIIAAIGKNRELGKQGDLIWRISADLKRVKELTTGHPIIMGRKTYESIGRPLPNRTNIVVSRSTSHISGCLTFDSLEKALEKAKRIDQEEIFVFGGARLYEDSLSHTDRLYLTLIDAADTDADVYFPDHSAFTKKLNETPGEENGVRYKWVTLEK